jgi:hypothetical protein
MVKLSMDQALQALLPFVTAERFDSSRLLAELSPDRLKAVVAVLGPSLVLGQPNPGAWSRATGAASPKDFAVALGALWDELVSAGAAVSAEGMPPTWTREGLRLWAYTEHWILLSQDEDLMLMEDDLIPDLLEIAAERSCLKRDWILAIVAHWGRDAAFAAIGTERFADTLTRVAQRAAGADAAGAHDIASYFRRLGSYVLPCKVTEDGARQRGLDLTRCSEPPARDVSVKRDGKDWHVTLPGYLPKTLKICALDGKVS